MKKAGAILASLLLTATCGGTSDGNENGSGVGGSGAGGGSAASGGSGAGGQEYPPVEVVDPGEVDQTQLQNPADGASFATLTTTDILLPFTATNARETNQSVRYIARTDQEDKQESIKIPIRSYFARCTNPNGVESVFVSLTLQDGDTIEDNVGSVFEMQYDADSGGYQRVNNSVKLDDLCLRSHGVAVSSDCSRVAVLCQTEPFASQNANPTKDLVELYGDTNMKKDADNYDEVGDDLDRRKANMELWLLEWENEPLSNDFESYVVSKQAGGAGGKNALTLLHVEDDSLGRTSYGFAAGTRVFDSGGGSHHSSALYVVNRDDWSYDMYNGGDEPTGRGWSFDCIHGHILQTRALYNPYTERYSAICTSDLVGSFGGDEPWFHAYGTVGIKEENREAGSKGSTSYFVPSSNTYTSNGGGHTVVPVDENMSLMVLVAPQVTPLSDMANFVDYTKGFTGFMPGMTDDQACGLYEGFDGGCDINFFEFMVYDGDPDDYRVFNSWVLDGSATRDPKFYSNIGLVKIAPNGRRINGEGIRWIIGDRWDLDGEDNVTVDGEIVGDGSAGTRVACNYSSPQLVDLHNGRYLLGFAKFLCSDHGYTANRHMKRSDRLRGGADVLIPQAYYLAEIDVDGNILAGPTEVESEKFGDLGWGGIDEMIALGPGKVGWFYTSEPTKEPEVDTELPAPLQRNWRMTVYESALE